MLHYALIGDLTSPSVKLFKRTQPLRKTINYSSNKHAKMQISVRSFLTPSRWMFTIPIYISRLKVTCDVVVNISLLQPSTYFPIYIQRTSYFVFQYAKTSTFCRFVSLSIKYVCLKPSGYVTFVGLFQRYWNTILVFQISHNAFW